MLGVLVAPGGAQELESAYLVTVEDLAPGEPIDPETVEPRPMALPADLARHALTDPASVEGGAARFAVPAGTVLHEGLVRDGLGPGGGGPELTISVPERRAVGGGLAVGDSVDVVATYGSGTEGLSEIIAADAVVTGAALTGDSLGIEAAVAVTLRLEAGDGMLPVVHAAHADAVTLVAASPSGAADTGRRFRPVPPEATNP